MKHMIQQVAIDFLEEVINHFLEQGVYDIGEMMQDGLKITSPFLKKLICEMIASADRAIVEAKKERKVDGITVHQRDVPRTLLTALGPLTYKRTYFHTPTGRVYLLDNILGVNAYERVDTTVSAAMVNSAGLTSFARSADIVTGGMLSRQTAWKKAMGTGETYITPTRPDITPDVLHIFADEDHVNLQNGKNAIVPLVTVCAGKEHVSKGRNKLINPIHIGGYGLKPDEHRSYVYACCSAMYDMDKVRKVIIYSDAGRWIGTSEDYFANPIYILDEYHYKKRIKALLAGDICEAFAKRVHGALDENRREQFQKLIYEMTDAVSARMEEGHEKRKRIRHILHEGGFILKHWERIQNRKDPDSVGSCTEALISHVLSERFSRSPMGWSESGLQKMTALRIFIKNGGEITPLDIHQDRRDSSERKVVNIRIKKYEALVQKQQAAVFSEAKDWRFRSNEDGIISQAHSGTRHLLRCLGKERKSV